jgi:hypothetical protein
MKRQSGVDAKSRRFSAEAACAPSSEIFEELLVRLARCAIVYPRLLRALGADHLPPIPLTMVARNA